MEKTKPIIRILLGVSLIMLISGGYKYFTNVVEMKDTIKICIGVLIPIFLYLRKYIIKDTLLKSLKDLKISFVKDVSEVLKLSLDFEDQKVSEPRKSQPIVSAEA